MKKILLSAMTLLAVSTASAYDFPYMQFTLIDGSTKNLNVEDLTITFTEEGKIEATNGTQNFGAWLSTLVKMAFVNPDGVNDIVVDGAQGPAQVYTLSGCALKTYPGIEEAKADLAPGLYIVKQADKVVKLVVK